MRFSVNIRLAGLYIALAAAEVCWTAPVFLALTRSTTSHPPLATWLSMLALLLGFCYVYRLLLAADLAPWVRQGLLVITLLATMALLFRFHLYAGADLSDLGRRRLGLRGIDWLLQPFRNLADLTTFLPVKVLAAATLLHLWARGIHLACRSLSAASVGFSFRGGVIILIALSLAMGLSIGQDLTPFVISYFFCALVAVALARVEEIASLPGSSQAQWLPLGSFWIGSTIGAVALVLLLGLVVASFLQGGGLKQVLRWLSPLLDAVVVGLALLILAFLNLMSRLLPIEWKLLGDILRDLIAQFQKLAEEAAASPGTVTPTTLGRVRASLLLTLLAGLILLVIIVTWRKARQNKHSWGDESRESLLSAALLARSLRAMMQTGRKQVGRIADLVDQFGLGARLFTALTVRRIYANLVRLATKAGYPRQEAQTPTEYLEVLCRAWPDRQTELAAITDAYVKAHYGQIPDSREELQRIRNCWERVQTQGPKKRIRQTASDGVGPGNEP